jgi:hypothetical protein
MAEHEIPDFEIPKRERRAWVRLPSDREVSCRPMAGAADTTGWLLILRQKFDVGTRLFIDLATNAGEVRSLSAHVVRVSLERDGCWVTGCEFDSTLSPAELQSFLTQ